MATASLVEPWVKLPHCKDHVALARRFLREEIAFQEPLEAEIRWAHRRKGRSDEWEEMPAWPASVRFWTAAGK